MFLLTYVKTDETSTGPDAVITNEFRICQDEEHLRNKVEKLIESEGLLLSYEDFKVYQLKWDKTLNAEVEGHIWTVRERIELETTEREMGLLFERKEQEYQRRRLLYEELKTEFDPEPPEPTVWYDS